MELKRINVNFDAKLLEKIDNYAAEMGINRTSAISVLISNQFRQDEAMSVLSNLYASMQADDKGEDK